MENSILINTNDITKARIKILGKPGLWNTPHYFLCYNKEDYRNSSIFSFLNFTSNLMNIISNNIAGTNSIAVVNTSEMNVQIFPKTTYIVLNEQYMIGSPVIPERIKKHSNCFRKDYFDRIKQKINIQKQFRILNAADAIFV